MHFQQLPRKAPSFSPRYILLAYFKSCCARERDEQWQDFADCSFKGSSLRKCCKCCHNDSYLRDEIAVLILILCLTSFNHPHWSVISVTVNLHNQVQQNMNLPCTSPQGTQEPRSLLLVKCITCLVVMHPVQHDLRSPVPPGSHIPSHLIICVSSQAKIQDLQN